MMRHLAKGSHEWSDLAVVRRINVSTSMHQKLDHIKMTAVCRQPERSVSFLVSYIDVGTPAQREKGLRSKVVLIPALRNAALALTY